MRELKIDRSITRKDQESLVLYLQELRRYPLLTAEEELNLGKKIAAGDESAFELLVRSNLRFVVSVAKKYEGQGILLTDLVAEGNIGLMKAARRFDFTRGFKFISFAVWWIRQAIQQAIDHYRRIVRLPGNYIRDLADIRSLGLELEQKMERPPTLEELAEATDIKIDKIKKYQYSGQHSVSLDLPPEREGTGLYDVLSNELFPAPDTSMENEDLKCMLQGFLKQLPDKEREILELSFGLADKQRVLPEDIALSKDVTVQTIRLYKKRGLQMLKDNIRFQQMRHYLEN